jgi:hypothetical protein
MQERRCLEQLDSQVEILPANDDGVGHFGRVNDTGKNASADRDISCEGALLIDIGTAYRLYEWEKNQR